MSEVSKLVNQMGPGKMLTMAGVVVGLIVFFVFISSRLASPNVSLLFANLEPSEAASVAGRLQGLGVVHELRDGNRSVYADSERVASLRLSLAEEGIGGSIVGMELFDQQDSLGTTSFVQNINFIRAIEGELQRTLIEINGVRKARIHVNMPQRQLFKTSARQASASVLLTTGGAGLTPEQVLSIRALVATAVPGLDSNNITISDQRGSMLARGGDTGKENLSSSMEEQRSAQEGKLRSNIEKTLEAIVGPGRVRAEVAIQMQMSRITTNAETYDPEGQVQEATQTKETQTQSTDGSNSSAVSVGQQLPDAGGGTAGGGAGSSGTTTDEVVNFLNSRTVTTEVKEPGDILRVSVGIVIDHKRVPDANADSGFAKQPWSQAELDQMTAMTRAVIGFDQTRGDEVTLSNMEFASMEQIDDGPIPFNLFGLNKTDIKSLIEVVVIGIVSILVLLLVIRPLVLRIAASIPEASAVAQAQLETLADQSSDVVAIPSPDVHGITPELAAAAASGDDGAVQALTRLRAQSAGGAEQSLSVDAKIDVAQVEGKVQDTALKKVGDIVTRHPEESASIVRQWLYSE